jgi:SAM-dependent methyltransferase
MRPGSSGGSYDELGAHYTVSRRPDPRIAARIREALGDVGSVVNVGAGAGSYEPHDVRVLAVEPSLVMIRQRPPGSAPVVRAHAEHLPLRDGSFDAGLAVLTVHHWRDRERGLAELGRVTIERIVIVTWDPAARDAFWLTARYFPEIAELDAGRFPSIGEVERVLGPLDVRPLLVPHDCSDGFLGAFWQRPAAYLDPHVRRAMSAFARLPPAVVDAGLALLAEDLASGRWLELFGEATRATEADLGYRVVSA